MEFVGFLSVLESIFSFILRHWEVFLFYSLLIWLIYLNRGKFDWQARFIGLYRTKVGIKLMERISRHEKLIRFLGYVGIYVGFAGMLFILAMLGQGVYNLVFVPEAPPVVAPVIPGVTIPGLGITVPLVIGWIALFLVILVHEFSHGVVSKAHKIPVKSSGLMVFGPIGGAFVEPEEKKLRKAKPKVQLSIFAAGPFSNVLLALLMALILQLLLTPLLFSFVAFNGVLFSQVTPGSPAAAAGVQEGVVYDVVGNRSVNTSDQFLAAIDGLEPGDELLLASSSTGEQALVTAGTHPQDPEQGYLGVLFGTNLKDPSLEWLFHVVGWLAELATWTFILSLGIGLANLLPLGPVDGGRMLQVALQRFFKKEQADQVWKRISLLVLLLILLLLIVPFVIKPLIGLF